MRVIFLDVDGVLNRTGFQPADSVGLRSWIEAEPAARLAEVIAATGAGIVLSSDWRRDREIEDLREELVAAGVECVLVGTTPVLGGPRWREIEAWMVEHQVPRESIVIIDDAFDMGPLSERFVRIRPSSGLDEDAVQAIIELFRDLKM